MNSVTPSADRLTYISKDLSLAPPGAKMSLFVERVGTVGKLVRGGFVNAETAESKLWDIARAHKLCGQPGSEAEEHVATVIADAVALVDEGPHANGHDGDDWTRSPSISPDDYGAAPIGNDTSNEQQQKKRQQQPPRFNLVRFDQIKRKRTSAYLIKGLIPRTGLVVIWGPPKCGKSFWTFDAMLHIALNWEYRDRRVTAGKVVYLALEGQDGFGDRAEAFRLRHADCGDVPGFYLVKQRTDLVRDHIDLIKCIRSQCDGAPSAVVIDTMNRSLVGSESKDEDMAAYIKAADAIREAFTCAVIIIHHCGIDGTRPRGHTSLTGAADVQISVKRDAANNIITEVECAKDMEEGAVITSRLNVVELGEDQDGDQQTSCVVVPVEISEVKPAPDRKAAKGRPPKGADPVLLTALNNAVLDHGELFQVRGDGPHVRAVRLQHVREEFYRGYVSGDPDPEKRNDKRRKAFVRGINSCIKSNEFATETREDVEWIWTTTAR
jgi:hypothetical protein